MILSFCLIYLILVCLFNSIQYKLFERSFRQYKILTTTLNNKQFMSQTTSQSLIKFAKSHPISLSITLMGTVSASIIYYFSAKSSDKKILKKQKTVPSQQQKEIERQQQQIEKQLNRLRAARQRLFYYSKDFKVQYLEETKFGSALTQQCVLNIFDKCIELVDQEELNIIYETSRKARRTIFHKILINAQIRQSNRRDSLQSNRSQNILPINGASPLVSPRNMISIKAKLQNNKPISYPEALSFSQIYYRFVCTFQEEFKYLIQKTQKDFAAFLNIDFSIITQSIDFHISKEKNQLFKQKIQQWTSSIRQTLKNKLVKYSETIDPQQIRQILNFQISYLKQKRIKLRQTIHKLGISNQQQLDALPTLLATILEDAVYNKYHIEQQQMTVDIMHLSKNKELQILVQNFQQLTGNIVQQMYQEVNKDQILNDSEQI